MSNLRQTILIRTDLTFPVGLIAAQVAHIHMERFRQAILQEDIKRLGDNALEWLNSPYIFVHGVHNPEALNHFRKLAGEASICVTDWTDTVFMQLAPDIKIAPSNVLVGCSLGPDDSDKIKSVIGSLPLL